MNIYEAKAGESIYGATKEAKFMLYGNGIKDGKILFNELMIPFSIDSNETDIAIIYSLMHENRRLKNK